MPAFIGTADAVSSDVFGSARPVVFGAVAFVAAEPVKAQVDSFRGIEHTPLENTGKAIVALVVAVGGELLLRKGGAVDIAKKSLYVLRDTALLAKDIDAMTDATAKAAAQAKFLLATGKTTADLIALALAEKAIAA